MTTGIRERVKSLLNKKDTPADPPKLFRDVVIESARRVAIHGQRETVPLKEHRYYVMFGQAKAIVMERERKYPLHEARVFERAAQIILESIPRFRRFKANAHAPLDEKKYEQQVKLFIRQRN